MGLLDALFNSDTYGGQGGGLLDFLKSTQMQNDQYQPSPGFPLQANQPSPLDNAQWPSGPGGAPSSAPASFADRFNALPGAPPLFAPSGRNFADATPFDPATYAPNQAQPIAVGDNYMMPRIGGAAQYASNSASGPASAFAAIPSDTPPNAPTDVSAQSRQPATAVQPDTPGFGDRMTAGLQNFANARGPLQALVGGITGLSSGKRTDALGIQQQNQSELFKALVEAGMPRNTAMAAALNPKLLEQVGPGYFAKNDIVEGGTDPLTGKKTFVLKNTVDGTVKELNANGGAAAGGGGSQQIYDNITTMRANGATRDQLIKQIPAAYQGDVDALLTGKGVPANMGRSAIRGQLISLAHAIDPTWDETKIPQLVQARKDYAPNGKAGSSIVAMNTVQHHIGKLSDSVEELAKAGGGTDFPALNSLKGIIANNTSLNPKLRQAMQGVNDDILAVTDEMSNAYKAGHVTDSQVAAWNRLVNSNMPADQLRKGLSDFVGLLNGKRDQLNETHQSFFHEDAPAMNKELNEATTAKVQQRLNGGSAGAASKPATVIQNGHTYSLQADGSYK